MLRIFEMLNLLIRIIVSPINVDDLLFFFLISIHKILVIHMDVDKNDL